MVKEMINNGFIIQYVIQLFENAVNIDSFRVSNYKLYLIYITSRFNFSSFIKNLENAYSFAL